MKKKIWLRFSSMGILVTVFCLFSVGAIYAKEEKEIVAGKKMVLPPPSWVGVVVKNLDEAMAYYSETYGLGPFRVGGVEADGTQNRVKGEPSPIKLKTAHCQWGPLELELIEPVGGDSPLKWFLQEKGEGLQHLGFRVENYDEWLAHLKEKGIGVLMNAEIKVEGKVVFRAAYMESDAVGGVLFQLQEIISSHP